MFLSWFCDTSVIIQDVSMVVPGLNHLKLIRDKMTETRSTYKLFSSASFQLP
jgi:hypothetical protein